MELAKAATNSFGVMPKYSLNELEKYEWVENPTIYATYDTFTLLLISR